MASAVRFTRPLLGLSRFSRSGNPLDLAAVCHRKHNSLRMRLSIIGVVESVGNSHRTLCAMQFGFMSKQSGGLQLNIPQTSGVRFEKLVTSSTVHKRKSPQDEYELLMDDYEAGMTEEEMDRFILEILTAAQKKDVTVRSVNRQTVKEMVDDLLVRGWSPYLVRQVFLASPVLLTKSRRKLDNMIEGPYSFGFTNEQIATLLTSGVLSDLNPKRFMATLECLMKVGMRDGPVQAIVSRFPELLTLSPKEIEHRVSGLKELFRTDDIVPLILKAPRILTDDWSEVADKFNYVFWTMGVKQRQMVRSKLFRYPLHHVKTRHMFLVRENLYVRPRRDDDPVRQTNPKLRQILDTSDEEFLQKFGDRSLAEYKDFRAKIKQEFTRKTSENHSDSETDEDELEYNRDNKL